MKLTIMTETSSVGKDGLFFDNLNLTQCGVPPDVWALQWQDSTGHIEFNSASVQNQDITSLPTWANNCLAVWQVAYDVSIAPPPPPLPPTAEQNKATAAQKLSATDWTTISDVSDPAKSNPYLANVQDFITYRNAVRQYAVYPVAGNINWPAVPQEVWTKV
jgi:hypothetical protein